MSRSAWLLGLVFGLCSCAGSSASQQGPETAGSEAGGAGASVGGTTAAGGSWGGSGGTAVHAGSGAGGAAGFAGGGGSGAGGGSSGGSGTGGGSSGGSGTGGGSSGGSGTGGGSSSGGGSSLADVQAIFDSRCVNCHDKSKAGLPTYPQLSLVANDALAALVSKPATEPCGGTLVTPGDPDHSYLIHKLSDATPCDGMRMPRAFEGLPAPPLTPEQMTTIRSWISAGAKP